jgi:hypothetical protein
MATRRYLRVAREHVETLRELTAGRSYPVPGPATDAAAVVTVFAAAAAESALNHFIALPVLAIPDEDLRTFFGRLVTYHARLSMPDKIAFVRRFCPELGNELLAKVRLLSEARNSLVHARPTYEFTMPMTQAVVDALARGEPDEEVFEALDRGASVEEIAGEHFVPHSRLVLGSIGTEDVDAALEHYGTAETFIEQLSLHRPSFFPDSQGSGRT